MVDDDDSDQFQSADEGGPAPESYLPKTQIVTCAATPAPLSEIQTCSPSAKEDSGRKQKKKVKKRKNTATTKKQSKGPSSKVIPDEDFNSIGQRTSDVDVGTQLKATDDAVFGDLPKPSCITEPASSSANACTEKTLNDVSKESSATFKILQGMGDRLSVLADAVIHPLQPHAKDFDVTEDRTATQRQQRIAEEKAERKAIAQAWSDVWNATWGIDDGWEVDDNLVEELNQDKVEVKQESSLPSPDMSAKIDEVPRPTSFTMWDWSSVSNLAQQLTSSLHTTGVQLVQEGVGVLETIGKKTMSVIEENDPGFYHTKKLLRPPGLSEHPTLSEVIREAHTKNQHKNPIGITRESEITLVSQLEAKRGLVHLEAIKLVGEKAETQLHLHLDTRTSSVDCESQMELIWTMLQMEPEEEDNTDMEPPGSNQIQSTDQFPASLPEGQIRHWQSFQQSLNRLNSVYSGERLLKETTDAWCTLAKSKDELSPQELFRRGVCSLANLTSAVMEFLHKTAECVLVQAPDQCTDVVGIASEVVRSIHCSMELSTSLCGEYIQLIKMIGKSANQSAQGVQSSTHSSSQLVASLLLESSNAQSYLRDAAQLLVPVFQLAYVESCALRDDPS